MQYILKAPASFNATIKLPASKSISNRALIIHALSNSDVLPQNLSVCDDTEVVVNALMSNPDVIDIKAAGTAMRFMTAYLSVTPGEHVITGTERMQNRPIGILVDALRYLGADIEYVANEGYPPLRIKGHPLEGGYLEIPGNVSSQYISALLMIGPVLKNGLELRMTGGIISRPYIDLTLWMMREFGADADWSDMETVKVNPHPYNQHKYLIESDWSASSYWYEMMALTDDTESQLMFEGLMDASKQGDSIVKYIYSLMGVKTRFAERADNDAMPTVTLKKQHCMLPRLDYDFISAPDLAQTVVVTCALLNIPFKFTGLASLKIKETDRIEARAAQAGICAARREQRHADMGRSEVRTHLRTYRYVRRPSHGYGVRTSCHQVPRTPNQRPVCSDQVVSAVLGRPRIGWLDYRENQIENQ